MKLVQVSDGYIVADALLSPVIELRKLEISRVLGSVDAGKNRLSPVFPEKKMARIWWKNFGNSDADVDVDLPEWLIVDLWWRTYVYRWHGFSSVRVLDYVRKLMLLYGVVNSKISGYVSAGEFSQILAKLCSVVDNDVDRISVIGMCHNVFVKSYYSKVKISLKKSCSEVISVLEKYACEKRAGWYYVRKSEAPEMVNELLKMRWW